MVDLHLAVYYLFAEFATIKKGVKKRPKRGIVYFGKKLREVYEIRDPLYRRWAHKEINVTGRKRSEVAKEIAAMVRELERAA